MKILLITSFFPPTHTAGTEQLTYGFAKTLLEHGHQVQILCAGDWESGDHYWNGFTDEIFQNIPVRRIHLNWYKSPDPNTYLYNNPITQSHIQEWLGDWKPDLIHITSCITLSASVITAARACGLPVVLTLTDFWFICHKLSLLKYDKTLCDGITTSEDCIRCLFGGTNIYQGLQNFTSDQTATRILNSVSKMPAVSRQRGFRGLALNIDQRKAYLKTMLNNVDVVTAPSRHLRDTFYRSGITKEIQVIQSGHDLSWLPNDLQKKASSIIRIGYIGQIIYVKGIHTLIEAFGAQEMNGRAELHLYGNYQSDTAYYQTLQKISNLNPKAVFYHGPFPHEELGAILADIDILVVPSLWHENNPRVIQEAFASKTPVIASDVGGIAEYIQPEVNGLLFHRGESEDLSVQLNRIVNNPGLIDQFRMHIPNVKNISEEIDEYETIYNKLAGRLEVIK